MVDPDEFDADAEPDAGHVDAATGGPRPTRTVPAGAFVVALMAAMALGILAVYALATDGSSRDGATTGDVQEVQLVAGRFGERFLTIRYDEIDEWKTSVTDLTTGGFAGQVDEIESSFRQIMGTTEMVATAQVQDIFLGDIDRGSVSVVLRYDRNVTSTEGTRVDSDRYMQIDMDLVDGQWLIDQVFDISTLGSVGSPASPTSVPPAVAGPDDSTVTTDTAPPG